MNPPRELRLSTAEDIVTAVPYLVRMHPDDALVTITLTGSELMAAVLLPHLSRLEEPDRIGMTPGRLTQNATDAVILVGYGPADVVDPVIGANTAFYKPAGVEVRAAVRVDAGRYFCYCGKPGCAPSSGMPLPTTPTVVDATLTSVGWGAVPDLAAVEAQVTTVTGDEYQQMRVNLGGEQNEMARRIAGGQLAEVLQEARGLLDHWTASRELPGPAVTARLVLALRDDRVRAHALQLIDATDRSVLAPLWQWLLRRALPGNVAGPALVFAYAAWHHGDGGLATLALKKGLEEDPQNRQLRLLFELVRAGKRFATGTGSQV